MKKVFFRIIIMRIRLGFLERLCTWLSLSVFIINTCLSLTMLYPRSDDQEMDFSYQNVQYSQQQSGTMIRINNRALNYNPLSPNNPYLEHSPNLIQIIKQTQNIHSQRYSQTYQNDSYINDQGTSQFLQQKEKEDSIFYSESQGEAYERRNTLSFNFNRAQNHQTSRMDQEEMQYKEQKSLQLGNPKQKKKNNCATKNMLQYFWKVTMKNLEWNIERQGINQGTRKQWNKCRKDKASRSNFTKLFKQKHLRPYIGEMFNSKHYLREIISSGVDLKLKIVYRSYIKVLFKGFKNQDLPYLK